MSDLPLTNENLAQRLSALNLANDIRVARARDKKAIKRRELNAADILRDPPPHWKNAALVEVLLSVPKVGRVKAQKWATIDHVKLSAKLIHLTVRQRELMARQVEFHVMPRRPSVD